MKVKHPTWFASGPEVERALHLLSDGAFRLYFYLCLKASRRTGLILSSYLELAQILGRSRRAIMTYFDELRQYEVCRIHPAVNQYRRTEIEICDNFWPYTKDDKWITAPTADKYYDQIRSVLSKRVCVRIAGSATDEKFASELFARQVPIDQIEQAVALGCCRKYVSMLNGTSRGFIFSFAYFRDLIEEVGEPEVPFGYWNYVMPELEHLEEKWIAQSKLDGDAKSAQAAGPKRKETR